MLKLKNSDLIGKLDDLSTRSYNSLKKIGIITIQDLINYPKYLLINTKNLGMKTYNEINDVVNKINNGEIEVENIGKCELFNSEDFPNNFFVDFNGKKYHDIFLEDVKFTDKIKKYIKTLNIKYFSELLSKEYKILNLVSKKELITLEQIKFTINKYLKEIKEINKYIVVDDIFMYFLNLIQDKFFIDPTELYKTIMHIYSKIKEQYNLDLSKEYLLSDLNFISLIYKSEYMSSLFEEYILNTIGKNLYGCSLSEIFQKMFAIYNDYTFIKSLLEDLVKKNLILFSNELKRYMVVYHSVLFYLKEIISEKEYEIFNLRNNGEKLESIGRKVNLSRERIRQLENKIFKKIKNFKVRYAEDIFSDIFLKYDISKLEFESVFGQLNSYYYLIQRYKTKNCQKKLPFKKIIYDKNIPSIFIQDYKRIIYSNSIEIDGIYVACIRKDISEYILKNFAIKIIDLKTFKSIYSRICQIDTKGSKCDLKPMVRGFENYLIFSKSTLISYGSKFRYYDILSYDFEKLFDAINFEQYNNVEFSTAIFFHLYNDIMKYYDIQNEYELHNLLRKICTDKKCNNTKICRMPIIEIGNPNRDNQVMELMISNAPISNRDFAKKYESKYGVLARTVLGGYVACIDQYLDNGIYRINLPNLNNFENEKMKKLLLEDIYLWEGVKTLFKKEFPSLNDNLINSFTLKKLGFKVYSKYLIRDSFNSASEYFSYLLQKDDTLIINNFPSWFSSIQNYNSVLKNLKLSYRIVEFLPGEYISYHKLLKLGITKQNINDFCKSVLKFLGKDEYFTFYSLKKNGFSNILENFHFEDYFYTSLIAESINFFSTIKIGESKLIYNDKKYFTLKDFIKYVLLKQSKKSICVYELSGYIDFNYGIKIKIQRIIKSAKDSSMFYDEISEKIYLDYKHYYDNI